MFQVNFTEFYFITILLGYNLIFLKKCKKTI